MGEGVKSAGAGRVAPREAALAAVASCCPCSDGRFTEVPLDPILGGLLSGGASILGSIFGSQQNNQNALQMQQQAEAYNTQMSNTAYQRASADMTKAGLNPMMMFSSGSAASTPQIQPAQLQSAAAGIGPAMQNAISTATQQKTANATIDNLVAENAKIKADALVSQEQPTLMHMQELTEAQKQALIDAQTSKTAADTDLSRQALSGAINDAVRNQNELELRKTSAGKLLDQAGMAGRKVSDVVSPIGNIVSSARGAQSIYNNYEGGY